MEKKKKVLCIFFFRFFFFGDVIIHKTGTMLATGQGPGATPPGPGATRAGTAGGVRDHGGCGTGREGTGRNNKLGLELKYLSGGAPRAARK